MSSRNMKKLIKRSTLNHIFVSHMQAMRKEQWKIEEEIVYVENWINNRPMKVLNYMTPEQVFQLHSVVIAS